MHPSHRDPLALDQIAPTKQAVLHGDEKRSLPIKDLSPAVQDFFRPYRQEHLQEVG